MLVSGFELVYTGHHWDAPQVLFSSRFADDPQGSLCAVAATELGLAVCRDMCCTRQKMEVGFHAHTDHLAWSAPRDYDPDDPERAGQQFRGWQTPEGDVFLRWHLVARNSDPPAVYFRLARIVIRGFSP